MRRHPSPWVAQRHASLLQRRQERKAEHPFWGDRRLWAYRRVVEPRAVNQKRVLRLRRAQPLLVKPHRTLRAKRTPTGSQPRPTKPNEWWGIDMTKSLVEDCGWGSIVVVLEWSPTKIVGYYAGSPCTARHELAALDRAVSHQCPEGIRDPGLSLRSDHGGQPPAQAFMKACSSLGIRQAFTSETNPKGKADPERVLRTLKEAGLWLSAWTSPVALMRALDVWIADDHEHDWHST